MKQKHLTRALWALLILSIPAALFFSSCNDTGTSPFVPVIKYKRVAISAVKGQSITPDTATVTGGSVSGYSSNPALPAGLTFDATGTISGTPVSADSTTKVYAVTASGPSGSSTFNLGICVASSAAHPCVADIDTPDFAYTYPYLWGTTDTVFTDTPISFGGTVTSWSINPALPAGMSFNTLNGVISGKPSAVTNTWDYTVAATGPFGTHSLGIAIRIYDNAVIPIALVRKGADRFQQICSGCHGSAGLGSPPATPPHYHSDFLLANKARGMRIEFLGIPNCVDTAGTIHVNGVDYQNGMGGQGGGDSDIAGVLTFIRGTLNGATDYIHVEDVAKLRDSLNQYYIHRAGCQDIFVDTAH